MLYLISDPRYTLFVKPEPRAPAQEVQVPPEWGDFDLVMSGPPDACKVWAPIIN